MALDATRITLKESSFAVDAMPVKVTMAQAKRGYVHKCKIDGNDIELIFPRYPKNKTCFSFEFNGKTYYIQTKITFLPLRTEILLLIALFFVVIGIEMVKRNSGSTPTYYATVSAGIAAYLGTACAYYLIIYIVARLVYNSKAKKSN